MLMNRVLRSAVVTALLVPALALVAQASEPGNVKEFQKARHDHYHELGDSFKVVRDQTRASTPDMAAIKTAAKVVNDAAAEQAKWFPAGSGPEAGKTQALPAIWSKPAEFKAAMKMFSDAAPKLSAAANAGDAAAVKAAFAEVGKACKNCHEQFRAEEH
jgi:cytochrome c556